MSNDPTSFYCSSCKITHAGECEPRIVNIETGETLADMFMREAAILQLGQTLSVPEPPKLTVTDLGTFLREHIPMPQPITEAQAWEQIAQIPNVAFRQAMETSFNAALAGDQAKQAAPSVPEPPKADHGGLYYTIYNDGSVFYSDEFAQKVIAKTDLASLLKETNCRSFTQTRGPDGVAAFSPREPESPKALGSVIKALREAAQNRVDDAKVRPSMYDRQTLRGAGLAIINLAHALLPDDVYTREFCSYDACPAALNSILREGLQTMDQVFADIEAQESGHDF